MVSQLGQSCGDETDQSGLRTRHCSGRRSILLLVLPRYAVTACETGHYILIVFVVMSKEEGSMYRERLYILMILGRMSTSANSVEMFQH